MRIIDNLSEEQKAAVRQVSGPSLILAGAGSGKTRVLTHKVAYLISEGIAREDEVLLVTFTNKAAQEMIERVRSLLDKRAFKIPVMGTFHSLSSKILRANGKPLGISPNFAIFDEQDQLSVVKEAIEKSQIKTKLKPYVFLSEISRAKNELIGPEEFERLVGDEYQEQILRIYNLYQKLLLENNALDFDDLLFFVNKLFKEFPSVLSGYQDRFRFILVDEYQDVNTAQYRLTKLLSQKHKNLTVVGDACQAIYGFRGADFRNILRFQEDFSEAQVFSLDENYRSTSQILDVAFSVISKNTTHPTLRLWSKNDTGEKPTVYQAVNETDEANFVIGKILQSGRPLSSFAILYRTNAQSRVLEEAFLHAGMPYVLVGGVRFYQRKETKDVLSYLRVLSNPKDQVSKKRILKIGKKRFEKFLELQEKTDSKSLTTLEALDKVLEVTDYLSYFDDGTPSGMSRMENVKELRSVASNFPDLTSFLENVSLVELENGSSETQNGKNEAVHLMTIHAAKGLEFPIVFLIGMEEGLFPHSRSLFDSNELEEERRLCYVGMTRAKEQLFLTFCGRRLYFGARQNNLPSRFLTDIPQEYLQTQVKIDLGSLGDLRQELF